VPFRFLGPSTPSCFLRALCVVLAGCEEARPKRASVSFVESGAFQTYYAADGRVLRLLYDGDGDRRAEVVTLYGPEGRPVSAEIDSDRDGTIDRWEDLGQDGRATRSGSALHTPGRPDTWTTLDAEGRPVRRERDEDGDGRVDRIEHREAGRLVREEQDTDADGRMDVWRMTEAGGTVTEELDTDHDGKPDRRVLRNAAGEVIGIETDSQGLGVWAKVRTVVTGAPR